MKPNYRKILAENIVALQAANPELGSHAKLAKQCSTATRKIGARTIGHLLNWKDGPQPQLDTIVAVAEAFKLPPWLLLTEDFDAITEKGGLPPEPEVLELARRIASLQSDRRELLLEIFEPPGVPDKATVRATMQHAEDSARPVYAARPHQKRKS